LTLSILHVALIFDGYDYDPCLMFTNGEGLWANLEVIGKWRRLHIEEHYDLYSLPSIFRVIKPRRIRWAVHVARVGDARNTCGGFGGET
jgi:hypothetical protein